MREVKGDMAKILKEIIEQENSQFQLDGKTYHLTLIDIPAPVVDIIGTSKEQEEAANKDTDLKKQQKENRIDELLMLLYDDVD